MIIRRDGDHLLLITQPDHAAAAAMIVDSWQADGLPRSPRRDSIVRAVREHDNGWSEPDAAPIVDPSTGTLLDFVHAPVAVRQAVWPRGVDRLTADPWAAALVAQHAVTVYGRFRGDTAWNPFFAELSARRDKLIAASAARLETLLKDYRFLRLADLASLAFCNAWPEAQEFGGCEVQFGEGDQLSIRPDPFNGRTFDVAVRARRLANRRFMSAADASAAFVDAPVVMLTAGVRGE